LASTITTSVVTGGTNSHATSAAEINAFSTDFVTQGVNGSITSTSGVAPTTGAFAVNAQGTPAMFVDVTSGTAYITAVPSGQASQMLRVSMTATYTSYAISANSSGSTKYDWVYLKVDPTKANNPASDASDVTALFTSRSSSNSVDNGTPPTYGILLAVVTVANGASSITNANITDSRTQSTLASPAGLSNRTSETSFDFVASGCVWSGDSYGASLNGSMTAGVVYIGGVRVAVSAISAHPFTASKDTYVDVDNTGVITYTAVANNAASPALAANSIRIGIIVSGANIAAATSINQGQETRVLPIASSIPYAVTDSLGNLICPRDPNRKILGYRQILSDISTSSANTATNISVPVIVPTGRKIKLTFSCSQAYSSANSTQVMITIWDGTVGSGTAIASGRFGTAAANQNCGITFSVPVTPSASSKTYNIGYQPVGAATVHIVGAATEPAGLLVELV